ncbi:MAG: hypothetical protein IJ491_09800 [Clostridia bacterium]|nr:hypothetical protein [Clostridia bacterium]
MKATKHLHLNLQLFAEGGTAGGTAGAAIGTGEGAPGDSSQAATVNTGENNQVAAEDRAVLYKKFKADYKAEFDAEVQGIVKNRLKKSNDELNAAKQYREKADRILATVADKYGIDMTDLDGLSKEVEKDNAYYEDLALKNGTTPEQERRVRQVERENAQFKAKEAADARRAAQQQRYQSLMQQEAEVKAMYPNFDFKAEAEGNPLFKKLCLNGVSMKNAYEVVHHDEIMAQGMQFAAKQAAAKTQASIDANARRPAENGLHSSAAADTKVDVSKLTAAQMEEYAKQVKSGKRVSFG